METERYFVQARSKRRGELPDDAGWTTFAEAASLDDAEALCGALAMRPETEARVQRWSEMAPGEAAGALIDAGRTRPEDLAELCREAGLT